ncbi:uncharacterized protein CMC5_024610 [Chondromyces crocatus]|uniref:Uncharacterized protein n=2 Tax=Chondromyces crocatus TaxID=52 RepID=A0A0K1EBQ1_CHOCO|nr:uncharacterized protein CMC5_024610 [Chondromyces crocatus]
MKKIFALFICSSTVATLSVGITQPANRCDTILAEGIFGSTTYLSSSAAQEAYRKWQCATEIRDFRSAKQLGLSSKAIIYGIPASSSFNYDTSLRDKYKKDNCSDDERSVDAQHAYMQVRKYAQTTIIDAWSDCMRGNHNGLRVKSDDVSKIIKIEISYSLHHSQDKAPLLKAIKEINAQCISINNFNLPVLVPLGNGSLIYHCTRGNICDDSSVSIATSTETKIINIARLHGGDGQPCCEGQCKPGLSCSGERCSQCGSTNETCCSDNHCKQGNTCISSICLPCDTNGPTWYQDLDKDGYGDSAISKKSCTQPSGYVSLGGDCDDTDKTVNPGQTAWFSTPRSNGSYDYNCDGHSTQRWSNQGKCINRCRNADEGWVDGPIPGCGRKGTWLVDCDRGCGILKKEEKDVKAQECH